MPRFYFDVHNGERQFHDGEGSDLPDAEAAWDEAIGLLPDMAQDVLRYESGRVFLAVVRTEEGHAIIRAKLTLVAEWIDEDR